MSIDRASRDPVIRVLITIKVNRDLVDGLKVVVGRPDINIIMTVPMASDLDLDVASQLEVRASITDTVSEDLENILNYGRSSLRARARQSQ